jgi:hypothetical protein
MPSAKPAKSYVARNSAIYIKPPEFEHNDLKFSFDSNGNVTFDGVANESTADYLKWLVPFRTQHSSKLYSWPPKSKTQKWWRAMCSFRDLDTKGKIEDLQQRLHGFLVAEKAKQDNGEALTEFTILDALAKQEWTEWMGKNSMEKEKLWGALSPEEKGEQNFERFMREFFLGVDPKASETDVYVLKKRPRSNEEDRYYLRDQFYSLRSFALVYTRGTGEGTRYYRGSLEGSEWDYESDEEVYDNLPNNEDQLSGKTWVGTGFSTGLIVGRTQNGVQKKIEELCKEVEKGFISEYVRKLRGPDGTTVEYPDPGTFTLLPFFLYVSANYSAGVPDSGGNNTEDTIPAKAGRGGPPKRKRDDNNEDDHQYRLHNHLRVLQNVETMRQRADDNSAEPAPTPQTTRQDTLEWTPEEEARARALWQKDEARNPVFVPLAYGMMYRDGDVVPVPWERPSWGMAMRNAFLGEDNDGSPYSP